MFLQMAVGTFSESPSPSSSPASVARMVQAEDQAARSGFLSGSVQPETQPRRLLARVALLGGMSSSAGSDGRSLRRSRSPTPTSGRSAGVAYPPAEADRPQDASLARTRVAWPPRVRDDSPFRRAPARRGAAWRTRLALPHHWDRISFNAALELFTVGLVLKGVILGARSLTPSDTWRFLAAARWCARLWAGVARGLEASVWRVFRTPPARRAMVAAMTVFLLVATAQPVGAAANPLCAVQTCGLRVTGEGHFRHHVLPHGKNN